VIQLDALTVHVKLRCSGRGRAAREGLAESFWLIGGLDAGCACVSTFYNKTSSCLTVYCYSCKVFSLSMLGSSAPGRSRDLSVWVLIISAHRSAFKYELVVIWDTSLVYEECTRRCEWVLTAYLSLRQR
jgi:hypothetical protein